MALVTDDKRYVDMPLVASQLSEVDRAVLIRLVGHLADFLRAPGDWGYGTKLGDLTDRLIAVRRELRGL